MLMWWSHDLSLVARGLDIPAIKTVINFDVAKNIDTHVHRIGRTGRAGEKGTAFTLLTSSDSNFAGDLVRNLVRVLCVLCVCSFFFSKEVLMIVLILTNCLCYFFCSLAILNVQLIRRKK